METLFNDLQNHLAEKFGERISLIDEDYGQLEALQNGEDQYPVTFPCILISTPQTEWQNLKPGLQKGTVNITVRLAFDCYDDTHYGSMQENKAAERMATFKELNRYIHGWSFKGCKKAMNRTASNQQNYPAGIKVYSHTYTTCVEEDFSLL